MFLISLLADEVNAWNKSNNGEGHYKRFDYRTLFSGSRVASSSVHLKIFTSYCYVCPGNKITSDIQIASFCFSSLVQIEIFQFKQEITMCRSEVTLRETWACSCFGPLPAGRHAALSSFGSSSKKREKQSCLSDVLRLLMSTTGWKPTFMKPRSWAHKLKQGRANFKSRLLTKLVPTSYISNFFLKLGVTWEVSARCSGSEFPVWWLSFAFPEFHAQLWSVYPTLGRWLIG